MKNDVHASENHLTLAHHIPKLQSLEFYLALTLVSRYTHYFSPVASAWSLRIPPEVDTRVQCLASYYSVTGQLPMATAVYLIVFVNA